MDSRPPHLKLDKQNPRILVIRHRYVGDLVLVAPVLRNLRLQFPQAHISLLVDAKYRDVHAATTDIDEILAYPDPKAGAAKQAAEWLRLLKTTKTRRYDAVIDLTSSGKSGRLAMWTGAKLVSGFESKFYRGADQKRVVLTPQPGSETGEKRISDLYLQPIEAIGVPIVSREVRLTVRPDDTIAARSRVEALVGQTGGPLVVVHPGARLPTRRWPAQKFAAVCDFLQSEEFCRVLLLAGPGEEDVVKAVAASMSSPAPVLNAPATVPELAATFGCADVLLCNDSGPMHVAAAVGTPIVALFGAQSATLWQPTSRSVVLQPSLPCATCLFPNECQPPDTYRMKCIQRIEVETVIAATRDLKNSVVKSGPALVSER